MADIWAANIAGKLYYHGIKQKDVSRKMGVSRQYVGMILKGERTPEGGRERIEAAVEELIREKIKEEK